MAKQWGKANACSNKTPIKLIDFMKDLLTYIISHIANEPDKVNIEEKLIDNQIDFYVSCDPSDIGRIIGKKGKIIKALRRVLAILAVKEGKRVNIVMVDHTPTETA